MPPRGPIDRRPEAELLLQVSRVELAPDQAASLRALCRQDLDWDWLLRAAERHTVRPLLYWHLHAVCGEAVTAGPMRSLRGHFHRNAVHNLRFAAELQRVVELFEAHGVAAMPFKGPVLAAAVYRNLALREFADLDILVREEDVLRARELLIGEGYRPRRALTRSQEGLMLSYEDQLRLEHETGDLVELHWRFAPWYFAVALDPGPLWERATRGSLGSRTVLSLSPEDLLLVLCIHGAKHCWERLSWVCDVAELLRAHRGLAWDDVRARARALGALRMLRLGLSLAHDLLGAPLPEAIGAEVRADRRVRALVPEVRGRLFEEGRRGLLASEAGRHLFRLRARERLRDRIRYCVRHPLTPNEADHASLPLPAALAFSYPVLRPLRLLVQYGLGSWRRVS